jgi:transcriptional regulator with GAF, ATPase, and Fis domain
MITKVLDNDITVLIQGESGTGKELVAKAIHYNGIRKSAPFVVVNCASIPRELLESELFGHEKGSFTGAHQKKIGKFELANGGTIFLDEIGEMEMSLQAKILRVIQQKEFEKSAEMK